MKKEETITEHHPRASAEPTQVTATATCVPAHHRLYRTRLWQIVHAGGGIGCSCESCRGAEDEKQTDPSVADGSARVDVPVVLKEFVFVLRDYCRHETDLAERFRTLRIARSGLVAAAKWRSHDGAKKNVPAGYLSDMAMGAIYTELEIVRGESAERFAMAGNPVSNVKLVAHGAKAKIVDFANALLRLEGLTTCDGTKLSFADIVRTLGIAFNVDTPNLHIQRHRNRNRYKGAAQFMRRLAALLEKDSDEML